MPTQPLAACQGAWRSVSREVGGLSQADAAPPKPVALDSVARDPPGTALA